ncbi:Scn10a [Symbiodinium natans]|uniref:Scn10a protein n=1 Tax=Symbiodinium natans TaxID=878477 RepID=A0A812G4E0_9DINO|nr:Scn10a [Symbiodinium natans]
MPMPPIALSNEGYRDRLRGEVDMHMEHMLEDFRRLQTTMATVLSVKLELEKENASLRERLELTPSTELANSRSDMPKATPSLLSVALREDLPPENLELEFAEAFPKKVHEPAEKMTRPGSSDSKTRGTLVMRADSGVERVLNVFTKENMWMFLTQTAPALVIVLNTLAMGVAVDNHPEHPFWGILELMFALCYLMEFIHKTRMQGIRGYFRGPDWKWNSFDFFCLLLSFTDSLLFFLLLAEAINFSMNSASLIKVLRLARLLRLVRTLHYEFFNELRLIILGVFSGLRVLFWAIVLLFVLIYVFGIGMATIAGQDQVEFATLQSSMFTIFRCLTEGCAGYDGRPLTETLRIETFRDWSGVIMICYILVFMLVSVGVFNLIMAIFLDNVVSQQNIRKQKEISETALKAEVNIKRVVAQIISEEDGCDIIEQDIDKLDMRSQSKVLERALSKASVTVSRDRFLTWLDHEDFTEVLEGAFIDTSIRAQLFDILDADSGGLLSIDELISGLMSMRGDVTKGDIMAMSLKVRYMCQLMENLGSHPPKRRESAKHG